MNAGLLVVSEQGRAPRESLGHTPTWETISSFLSRRHVGAAVEKLEKLAGNQHFQLSKPELQMLQMHLWPREMVTCGDR